MAKPNVKFTVKDAKGGQFTWSVSLRNNEKLSASENIKQKANVLKVITNLVNAIRGIEPSVPTESLIVDKTKPKKKAKK